MTWRAIVSVALLLLAAPAASADWREYQTAHFAIFSDGDEDSVTRLAERLESIDALMRLTTGLGDSIDPVRVRIYVVEDNGDVEKALGLSGSGVAGFYSSNILGPFAVTPRAMFGQGLFTPELVLHHEYAHHFMLQYFPSVYPPWFVEGFAELIGSSKILPDGKVGYGMPAKHRGQFILSGWLSVDEVLRKPPHKLHQFDLYGQGWVMTHFLTFNKERSPQLRQYLLNLVAGKSPDEAARAFGDLPKLNREMRSYLDQGSFPYVPVPVTITRPVIQHKRPLGAGEAALIPETIAFSDDDLLAYRKPGARQREENRRGAILERIRDKVRRYPSDPAALHLLAEAEYAGGHLAEAEAATDTLLRVAPGHVRGLVRKSILLSQAAQKLAGSARAAMIQQARSLAVRANKADPADPLPLLAFYQSFHLVGETPTKDAVVGLRTAAEILPGDTAIRLLLVDQLAAEKKWAAAIAVLMPIANSPHPSPRRDAAVELLQTLQARMEQDKAGAVERTRAGRLSSRAATL